MIGQVEVFGYKEVALSTDNEDNFSVTVHKYLVLWNDELGLISGLLSQDSINRWPIIFL